MKSAKEKSVRTAERASGGGGGGGTSRMELIITVVARYYAAMDPQMCSIMQQSVSRRVIVHI